MTARKPRKPRTFNVWAIMRGEKPITCVVGGTKREAEACACCNDEYPVRATLILDRKKRGRA